tara:strand:+ start:4847 stop:5323 length:477 start_codon:yes stop_codon:yes gene_type:complete
MELSILLRKEEVVEPETLDMLYPDLSDMDKQTALALKVIYNNRSAFEDMDVFENIVLVLNGIDPNVYVMEGSTPEFIWKAVTIMKKIHPKVEFSNEIQEYIKAIFVDDGCRFFPPKSGIENPLIGQVKERAKSGPFPLKEDDIGIQALKYLKIEHYLK